MTNEFCPGSYKVLYVYSIEDGKHLGRLKVGDATYHTSKSLSQILDECSFDGNFYSSPEIIEAAKRRIDQQTKTADVEYNLLWAILAIKPKNFNENILENPTGFRDYDVHNILKRNNIFPVHHREDKKVGEWFEVDLSQIQRAVSFLVHGEEYNLFSNNVEEIHFRSEQEDAVRRTKRVFQNGSVEKPKKFLWSAIMRFGKTLTSYKLIEELNDVQKVLIVTHRPVVSDGWFEDFNKSLGKLEDWNFSSKQWGLTWDLVKDKQKYVYFASIQDLRGSKNESNEFIKNSEIFARDWDLIITDESHEGTSTVLAESMYEDLNAKYWLHLSGTPFNIIENFDQNNIYSWDYVDERKAKEKFTLDSPLDPNPYDGLPELKIYTYDISEYFKANIVPNNIGFNFNQFFATKINEDTGENEFVDPKSVWRLLHRLTNSDEFEDDLKNFPFNVKENVELFKHTFWLLPTVPAAKALEKLLNRHYFFSNYKIINVAGDSFEGDNALRAVQKEISKKDSKTITLSVGRLTTGVTVPEWTAVFLLSNVSSPMLYMQTIFRVKSGGYLPNGELKETGYVFDFAPDRTLTMMASAMQLSKTSSTEAEERKDLDELLKYLPIISEEGTRFTAINTDKLMRTLKRVYINKTVESGFETPLLYNFNAHKIDSSDVEKFLKLQKTVGKHQSTGADKVKIAESQLSEMQKELLERSRPDHTEKDDKGDIVCTPRDWDEAEFQRRKDNENKRNIIKVLNSISVRVPLLVFASSPNERITLDNFAELIDDKSWEEFMPKGFQKHGDESSWDFAKGFYDKDIFEGSCREIQERVSKFDELSISERIYNLARLFGTFRNPDKETVLTPWKVVNLQYANTLGGLRWVDDDNKWYCSDGISRSFEEVNDEDAKISPIWIDPPEGVDKDFLTNPDNTILDINSKTALYPLYAASSIFHARKDEINEDFTEKDLWNEIVSFQIFVNCRVPYSEMIAQKVLSGNSKIRINSSVIDLIEVRKVIENTKLESEEGKKPKLLSEDDKTLLWRWLLNPKDFNQASERCGRIMSEDLNKLIELAQVEENDKFTAVVSNPPYQIELGGKSHQIYADFYLISKIVGDYLSMIFPIGWQRSTGKASGSSEHLNMRKDCGIVSVRNYFENSLTNPLILFPGAATGGVNIVLRDFKKKELGVKYFEYSDLIEESKDLSNVKYWSDMTGEIFDRMQNWISSRKISSMESKLTTGRTFGLRTFVTNEERPEREYVSKTDELNSIKFLAKDDLSNKYIFWNVKKNAPFLKNYKHFLDSYQLAWPKSGANSNYRKSFIVNKKELVNETFLFASFKSKEEANNFQTYFKTMFYRFCITEVSSDQNAYPNVHRFVPDLTFIKNPRTGKIGWESDWTDEDLKILFKDVLTDEDWEYIQKVAIESDPAGMRK